MIENLLKFTGVSWPRSGHHLLVELLSEYFGEDFKYCEYYNESDCCRTVPCRRNDIIVSKSHDYIGSMPILEGKNYLIQYRNFSDSVVSNFELYIRNGGFDNEASFRAFAESELHEYLRFMSKWEKAKANNSTFLRVDYDDLVSGSFEVVSSIISEISPSNRIDSDRLRNIIQNSNKISIQKNTEEIEIGVGIKKWRNIESFRFFDFDFFKYLHNETDSVYQKMKSVASVCKYLIEITPSNQKVEPIDNLRSEIFIDITDIQYFSDQIPTGIPRVHLFIAQQALLDSDPRIRYVIFDNNRKSYRIIDNNVKNLIIGIMKYSKNNSSRFSQLLYAIKKMYAFHYVDKKFDRNFALSLVLGKEISGSSSAASLSFTKRTVYEILKNVVRIFRHFLKFAIYAYYRTNKISNKDSNLLLFDKFIFLSFASLTPRFYDRTLSITNGRACVIHDDIPINSPNFLHKDEIAQNEKARLNHLIHKSALIFCPSNFTKASIEPIIADYSHSSKILSFPMPSTLYTKAKELNMVDRISTKDPFVLYCSTIEVRKNHLMLAKVWKQALDDNDPLPKLLCVGKFGWGIDTLREFLKLNPQLDEHIQFLGAIDDVQLIKLYQSALFSVYPSHKEGWGLGASESLDFGLPVIISTAPALIEATRGLMPSIDPENQREWYRIIKQLSNDETTRLNLSNIIRSNYSPTTEKQSWMFIKSKLLRNL